MPSDYVSFLLCLVSLQFLSPTPLVTFSNSWHWVLPGPSCDHWIGTSLQVPSRGISGSTTGCNASLLTEYIHCSVVLLPPTAPNHSSTQVDQQAPSCTDPVQALAANLWLQWLYLAQKMRFSGLPPIFWLIHLFSPFIPNVLWTLEGIATDVLIRDGHSVISYFQHFVHPWVCIHNPSQGEASLAKAGSRTCL